jgi:hypothetical protein
MVPQQAHYQFRWLKSVSSTLGLVHLQFAVCYLLFHASSGFSLPIGYQPFSALTAFPAFTYE